MSNTENTENTENKTQQSEESKKGIASLVSSNAASLIVATIALIFSMAGATAVVVGNMDTSEPTQIEEVRELQPIHQHTWVPNVSSIHHEAVTETIEHEAVWGNVTTYHTICNECHEQIDGIATQHIAETGHSGYTSDVPVITPQIITEAWTEEVPVSDAYDETVTNGVICAECGEIDTFESASN